MNRHPQTATDDPLVAACSLCSFAVSRTEKGKFLQDCKNCKLQMVVFICRNT